MSKCVVFQLSSTLTKRTLTTAALFKMSRAAQILVHMNPNLMNKNPWDFNRFLAALAETHENFPNKRKINKRPKMFRVFSCKVKVLKGKLHPERKR